ncbi:hypothetical protein BVRB_5g111770 isoform A [Beta vulgaris subsp. vulgaris]|nr:hypothetical protein BVRB_5g111770 isoform A [Beta vulgaris subsp. vulgaris]
MVKRIRDDDFSPKSKKVKSVASSGKIWALSTAGKKKEKDGDYDPRCDKSLSKKKGKFDLSPIKFSFSRSNPDEQKDTFDRSNFTEQEMKSISLQVLSDYSHSNEVLLCPIADLGLVLKCAKSLEDASAISSYDWCGYILRSLCAAVLDCHQSIMMTKYELGQKKVTFKLRGCVSALTLAVIHNFKCRNLDYSNVSKPFITYWQEEKHLSNVVKQFEINMDFILPPKREKQKVEFKAPSVSAASRNSGSPIMKVVEGPSPSTRQLIMDLPHSLMTDEEIDALDVPEYVKNMHKLKRNALAFCQVNLEIAQNIREEGEKLSQDSISLDDSEVFNPDFLSQIDDICKRHLEAKDSANKVDPTISLLVKRPVELEFGRNKDVPDSDSGVHGVEEKEGRDEDKGGDKDAGVHGDGEEGGNNEKEPKEDDKKTGNADDDGGLQGDKEKGGNKELDAILSFNDLTYLMCLLFILGVTCVVASTLNCFVYTWIN